MEMANGTTVQEFILLGLEGGQQKRFLLLILFTILYIITLIENSIIITLVHIDNHLAQLPMYIFLGNFSLMQMCYVTTTMPRMIFDLASPQGVISFQGCFLQFYVLFSLGSTECFFLSTMALDRFLAICHPLRYPRIMSPKNCSKLVASCWIAGFLAFAVPVTLISRLSFCGPNIIHHFLCDQGPLLALACPPLAKAPFLCQLSMDVLIIVGNLLFVILSYGTIVLTLIKSSNQQSRKKAFSTISMHLLVVTLYYGSVIGMYVHQGGENHPQMTKIVTLFYTMVTPFLNPLIYCLRNDQVKEAVGRVLKRMEKWLRKENVM